MSRICFDRAAPCARWMGHLGPSDLGFPLSEVFIACWQRSLSVPKPAKQNGAQMATIVLSETRGLPLFLVIREGLGSGSIEGEVKENTSPVAGIFLASQPPGNE